MLWGENMQSYGSGSQRDPAHLLKFFREFPDFTGRLEHTPYPDLLTVTNAIYDTLTRIRAELGPEFAGLCIDPVRYRRYLLQDLERYIEFGHTECRPWLARIRRDLVGQRLVNLVHPLAAAAALVEAGRSVGSTASGAARRSGSAGAVHRSAAGLPTSSRRRSTSAARYWQRRNGRQRKSHMSNGFAAVSLTSHSSTVIV